METKLSSREGLKKAAKKAALFLFKMILAEFIHQLINNWFK